MNFKKVLPHLLAIISFVIISGIYFYPQIQGKKINQGDITAFKGMNGEAGEWREKTGDYPLWTNNMFGGMPTYQIGKKPSPNFLKYVEKLSQLYISRPMGYFISAMICMYILMMVLGVRPWVGAVMAIGFSLMTYNLILFEAGHAAKLRVFNFFPLVTAGVILGYRKKYILGGSLFALAMGVSIYANHIQMTYYLGLVLAIYVIYQLIQSIKDGEILDFAKSSGALLIGLLLAFGSSASALLVSKEYAAETMRGEPILEASASTKSESSTTDGLAWNYAMDHSHSLKDLMTYIIPGAAGGSSLEEASWSDDLKGDRGWSQVLSQYGGKAPLYHGPMPFTSGPVYLGIVIFFLFILSFFNTKGSMKWWALTAFVLTLIISMGKNFEIINRVLFDYFPYYNIFRSHNSIGILTPLITVMMGGLALENWLVNARENKDAFKHQLLRASVISVGLVVVGYIIVNMQGFDAAGDARFVQSGFNIDALIAARGSLLTSDTLRSVFLILLAAGALFAYTKEKINTTPTLLIITALILFDMISVGKRYLNADTFVTARKVDNAIVARPVDKQILKDPDPYYRVFDLSINTFNSAQSSKFHKTIGGYHAAKLQRYQDMISYHIAAGNQNVLNMLNTKYIITQDQKAQTNPGALGNAWFVDNVRYVSTNREEIDALNNFSPASEAIVHNEFNGQLSAQNYSGNGSVKLTEYTPEKLTYSAQNSGDGLAVFSEIWYGPDKGWKAYIDGNEVPLIRVNYILRAIEVPAGQHEIVMEFHPKTYYASLPFSWICSSLIILAILAALYFEYRNRELEA